MSKLCYHESGSCVCYLTCLVQFEPGIEPTVGDQYLTSAILLALDGSAEIRLAAALELNKALTKVVKTAWPVYSLYRSEDWGGDYVILEFLPSFTLPARVVAFKYPELNNPLHLHDFRVCMDPKLAAIEPGEFSENYKVPIDGGHAPFRAAVVALLKKRRADRSILFREEDE